MIQFKIRFLLFLSLTFNHHVCSLYQYVWILVSVGETQDHTCGLLISYGDQLVVNLNPDSNCRSCGVNGKAILTDFFVTHVVKYA